jgi:hypothetical protein
MARNRDKLDGGVPVGDPQTTTTGGNVVTPVAGLSSDAGAGKPPRGGAYGAIADGPDIPSGSKMPGGNSKAIGAFFGSQNPGGSGSKK